MNWYKKSQENWYNANTASSPNTSPDILRKILEKGNNDWTSYYAAENPNCPPDALKMVLEREKEDWVSRCAARNPNCSPLDKIKWMRATGKIKDYDPNNPNHFIEYSDKPKVDKDLQKLRKIRNSSSNSRYKKAQYEHLTPEELKNYTFDVTEGGHSITPKKAFERIENKDEYETLADLASYGDTWRLDNALGKGWEGHWDNVRPSTHLIPSIKANKPITVYRASPTGGILPGAYVTESKEYAQFHGETSIPGKFKISSIQVYPYELMTYDDPHEFIYMPKSVEEAHKRLSSTTPP